MADVYFLSEANGKMMVWKIRDLIAKAGRFVVGCSSSVALQIASSVISLAVGSGNSGVLVYCDWQ